MTISWPKFIGAWLYIAAGALAVRSFGYVAAGQGLSLSRLEADLALLALWAGVSPFVFRAARVFPVALSAPMPNAAIHFALGSAFIVASNLVIRLPMPLAHDVGLAGMLTDTAMGIATYYPGALVCYVAMVAIGQRLASTAESAPEPPDGRLVIREWNRVHFIAHDDIDWIEASNNHVVVHTGAREFKGRERISDVEARLDERRFVRVHRSAIVHLEKIREVQPLSRGDQAVILKSGRVVRVARSRRQVLQDALGTPL